MSDLVDRLTSGKHPVELVLRPERTVEALRECLARGYVHVKFTGTRGGTELGFPVNPADAALAVGNGTAPRQITIGGALTLDYVPVKCVAVISVPDMTGEGWLERTPAIG